jgi:hypothetical protein
MSFFRRRGKIASGLTGRATLQAGRRPPLDATNELATDRELARQVTFLKVENEILRSNLPARITVTAK